MFLSYYSYQLGANMTQGKQAKVLTGKQVQLILSHLSGNRYPLRNRVMFLLSVRAGLRAKEVASLTWGMVTDGQGTLTDAIELTDAASKGKSGRTIPLHKELRTAMTLLKAGRGNRAKPDKAVVHSERAGLHGGMSAGGVTVWFHRLYSGLGFDGCSSHSGRRTFITACARKVSEAGGSLRDVQQLAGHASLATTQRYVEGSTDAKRKLLALI